VGVGPVAGVNLFFAPEVEPAGGLRPILGAGLVHDCGELEEEGCPFGEHLALGLEGGGGEEAVEGETILVSCDGHGGSWLVRARLTGLRHYIDIPLKG